MTVYSGQLIITEEAIKVKWAPSGTKGAIFDVEWDGGAKNIVVHWRPDNQPEPTVISWDDVKTIMGLNLPDATNAYKIFSRDSIGVIIKTEEPHEKLEEHFEGAKHKDIGILKSDDVR